MRNIEAFTSEQDLVDLYNDINMMNTLNSMTPQQFAEYRAYATSNAKDRITRLKDSTIKSNYAQLQNNSTANTSVFESHLRMQDAKGREEAVLGTVSDKANNLIHDRDLAKRQVEINEWTVGNRRETLFIYQYLFIILCGSIVLTYLWMRGIIGGAFYWTVEVLAFLIFAIIVANRAQYTDNKRDKRYWNRRQFKEEAGVAPGSMSCQSLADASQAAFGTANDMYNSASQGLDVFLTRTQAAANALSGN